EESAIVRPRRNAPPATLALGNAADRQRLRGVFRRSGDDAGAAANLAVAAMGDGAGERLRRARGAAAATDRSGPAAAVHGAVHPRYLAASAEQPVVPGDLRVAG